MLRDEYTRKTFQFGKEIRLSEDWTAVTYTAKQGTKWFGSKSLLFGTTAVLGEFPEIYGIIKIVEKRVWWFSVSGDRRKQKRALTWRENL